MFPRSRWPHGSGPAHEPARKSPARRGPEAATSQAEGSQPMSTSPGVPLCDLQAQFRTLEPELQEALMRVLRSGQVILGPEVAALENEIARYCGVDHAVGCSSG